MPLKPPGPQKPELVPELLPEQALWRGSAS